MTPDPLITAAALASRRTDMVVLDATYFLPADQSRARADYTAAHIPDALFFDIDAVSDPAAGLPHMLPPVPVFAAAMAALGIDGSRPVVVYDRSPNHFSAPRVWFTLQVFGLRDVFVLEGGFTAWQAAGHPVEAGETVATAVPPRDWQPDLSRLLSGPAMAALVAGGAAQIIDARGAARFQGLAAEPRPGLQSGHMPGARNLPFDSLTLADGRFADPVLLAQLFAGKAGPDTVLTCGSGMTAATLALGLARLGQGARLYDGSWSEWGQGRLGPIVTGE